MQGPVNGIILRAGRFGFGPRLGRGRFPDDGDRRRGRRRVRGPAGWFRDGRRRVVHELRSGEGRGRRNLAAAFGRHGERFDVQIERLAGGERQGQRQAQQ